MNTQEAIDRFLKSCNERGLSPATAQRYYYCLRHLPEEIPELPTTTNKIETYLRARGETPSKRGSVFRALQAFFTWLEKQDGTPSPVLPKGPVGRPPRKAQLMHTLIDREKEQGDVLNTKSLQGGSVIEVHLFIHNRGRGAVYHAARAPGRVRLQRRKVLKRI